MGILIGLLMTFVTGRAVQVTKTYEICKSSKFKTKHCELSRKLKTLKPSKRKTSQF